MRKIRVQKVSVIIQFFFSYEDKNVQYAEVHKERIPSFSFLLIYFTHQESLIGSLKCLLPDILLLYLNSVSKFQRELGGTKYVEGRAYDLREACPCWLLFQASTGRKEMVGMFLSPPDTVNGNKPWS